MIVVMRMAADAHEVGGVIQRIQELGFRPHVSSGSELVIVGCATDFCVDTTVRSAAARGYQVIVPSDGHTTRDRPHLSAQQVIAHHNYMWADLLLPRQQKVRVLPTNALLSEVETRPV